MKTCTRYADSYTDILRTGESVAEIALLTLLYCVVLRRGYEMPEDFGPGNYILPGLYGLLALVLLRSFEGFAFGHQKLSDVLACQWVAMLLVNFITYWQLCLTADAMLMPVPMLILTALDFAAALACCSAFTWLHRRMFAPRNMIMIYGREDALTLKHKMDTRTDKYRISQLISEDQGYEAIIRILPDFDGVILSDVSAGLRNDLMKFCYRNQLPIYLAPKVSDIFIQGAHRIHLFDTPLLLVRGAGLSHVQRIIKRGMDLALCLPAIVLAFPVMLATAAAIKLEDGGPVLFRQKRATLDGRAFEILKFRSMIVDAERAGEAIPAAQGDPRITRVGRIIRRTRLDELPQLLNILRGDMSFVGPRPERLEHIEAYSREIPEFAFRLKVKGGLTGYAQIYGKYNTSPYDKLRLDLMYLENYSLLLDMKLILLTLRVMLKKESTEGFPGSQNRAQTDTKESTPGRMNH